MKAFEYYDDFGTDHRIESKFIFRHLDDLGVVYIKKRDIAKYYEEFANTHNHNWKDCVEDSTLEEFTEWLSEKDI